MIKGFQDYQKIGKTNLDAAMQSMGQVNNGLQAIAVEMTGYTKKAFEEGTAQMEKLLGAKSLEQAVELQTSYVRKAYDDYVAQAAKLNGMYADVAKDAYKPVEAALAKQG